MERISNKVSFFGDIYVKNVQNFEHAISSCDLLGHINVINFEAPVISKTSESVLKTGPHLSHSNTLLESLKRYGISHLCLSNNHITDFGEDGVKHTVAEIQRLGMYYLGVADRNETKIVVVEDVKIGIFNVSEDEWQSRYSLDVRVHQDYVTYTNLLELRKKVDYLVVIYHGGLEHVDAQTIQFNERISKYVDVGSDLVLCHHSHQEGQVYRIGKSYIATGLGDFYFEGHTNTGVVAQLLITGDEVGVEFYRSMFDNITGKFSAAEIEIKSLVKTSDLETLDMNTKYEQYRSYLNQFSFLRGRLKLYRLIPIGKLLLLRNILNNSSHRNMAIYTLDKWIKQRSR